MSLRMPAGRFRVITLAVLLSGLSGCATHSEPTDVTAFHARVSYGNNGSVDFTYEKTATVWDLDGKWRVARDLVQTPPAVRSDLTHYLLDQNHRVVAIVRECASGDDTDCDKYTAVNWFQRGMMPPLGIGLLTHPSNEIQSWGGRHVTSATLDRTTDGDITSVEADRPWAEVAVPPYPHPQGPFLFHADQAVAGSAQWAVSDYTMLGMLPDVPSLPAPGPVPHPGTRSEFFPDTDENAFESNYTFQEFIDAARNEATRSGRPIPAGSCGVSFIWAPASLSTGGVLDPLPTRPGPSVDLAWRTQEGALRSFHVESSQDFRGQKAFQVTPSNVPVGPVKCDEVRRSPAPQAGPNDFLQQARSSPARGVLERFTWSVGLAGDNSPRPPEAGWDLYEFFTQPPGCGASCLLYTVSYEPASGALEHILGRPTELFHAG